MSPQEIGRAESEFVIGHLEVAAGKNGAITKETFCSAYLGYCDKTGNTPDLSTAVEIAYIRLRQLINGEHCSPSTLSNAIEVFAALNAFIWGEDMHKEIDFTLTGQQETNII